MTTKAGEQNQSEKSEAKALAKQWMEQEGMKERGAAGRIILAGNHLTRADLSVNWEIVAKAIKVYGSRPSVFVLEDAVAEFFAGTRPLGKPVPSYLPCCIYQCSFTLSALASYNYMVFSCQAGGAQTEVILPRIRAGGSET